MLQTNRIIIINDFTEHNRVLCICCVVRCVCWSAEECIDLPHMWICLQHIRPVSGPLVAYSEGIM